MSDQASTTRQPTQERAERSRRAILDAARRLFAERCYAAVSVNEIVLASGMTKGGFYFHFPSKLVLAMAVLEDGNQRWQQQLQRELAPRSDPVDRLFAVPRLIARMARTNEGPSSMRLLADELSRDPSVNEQVCGTVRTWVEAAETDFRAAQEQGAIRADLPPALLAEVAIAAFIGFQSMTDQFGDDDLERRVEALISVVSLAVTGRRQ